MNSLVLSTLVLVLLGIGAYYAQGYDHPPCCDTAVTLIRSKEIATSGSLNPPVLINPSSGGTSYTSLISTEIVTHLLLAGVYMLIPAAVGSLVFAKWFFIFLFLLPAIPLFYIARHAFRSDALAILTVLLGYFTFWFGNMFWTGHVAQFLGTVLVLVGILQLLRYQAEQTRKRAWIIFGTTGLLFFTHVLSFLVLVLLALIVFSLVWYPKLRGEQKQWLFGAYGIYGLVVLGYLLFVPEDSALVPTFSINELQQNFSTLLTSNYGGLTVQLVAALGAVVFIIQRRTILLAWFLVTYLLSQGATLGAPFYAYRFNEFIVVPMTLFVMQGVRTIISMLRSRVLQLIIIGLGLSTYLVFGIQYQERLKECYVSNCPGLNATQIPPADIRTHAWMDDHLPKGAVVAGFDKFAYYIPVTTDLRLERITSTKSKIFSDPSAEERFRIAKTFAIEYIVWGSILSQPTLNFQGTQDFTEEPFQQPDYFRLLHEDNGARVYAVK